MYATNPIKNIPQLCNCAPKVPVQDVQPTLVKDLVAFFWTMLHVLVLRRDSLTVPIMVLEYTTVSMLKMQESLVNLQELLPHHVS